MKMEAVKNSKRCMVLGVAKVGSEGKRMKWKWEAGEEVNKNEELLLVEAGIKMKRK